MLTAAILAGGLATRLRPLTDTIPKALLPVAGEPFISHQLRLLRSRGIGRVVLCVGYLGEMLQDFVGDGSRFGMEVAYSFDGPVPRGTGGAVATALPFLGAAFFVLYGDSYLPCSYAAVAEAFENSGTMALMTVYHNEGRWDASNVAFAGDRILAYDKVHKTPEMRYIDYGLGVFRREAFGSIPANRPCDLADVYQNMLRGGHLAAFEVRERFYEIGSVEGLNELSSLLASGPELLL